MIRSDAGPGAFLPFVILFAVGGAWGAVPAIARFAVTGGIEPMGYVFWVAIAAALLCWAMCFIRGVRPQFSPPYIRYYLLSGCTRFVLAGFIMYSVLQNVPAGIVAIILGTSPLMTFVASVTLKFEKFSVIRSIGIMTGLAGIVLMFAPGGGPAGDISPVWLLLALLPPLIYAYSNIVIDRARPTGGDSMALTAGMFTIAAVIALPLAFVTGQFHPLWAVGIGMPEAAMFGHAGILSFCFFGLYELIRRAGATFGGQATYVTTLTGVLYGMVLLGERPGIWIWAAAALVLVGVGLVNSGGKTGRR
jgi:drug/metabolite transporter (DMT)-like permease